MGFADNYLKKNKISVNIHSNPPDSLGIIVVIPAFNEPNLDRSLASLWNCKKPFHHTEVLIVFNYPENLDESIVQNMIKQKENIETWINNHKDEKLNFCLIFKPNLSQKNAGVGLARKIGMDEAIIRFNMVNKPNGIIANFDADSICDSNYFIEIEKHFRLYPKTNGISIYFEHPLQGNEFSDKMYKAIELYELHLRYYKQALQFTGFPYYFHTVGSAFAVKADVYCKQGGMNRQKAGEDFYFLQKIIPLGNYYELNTTRIIPSPRVSNRVPFGTGAAMIKLSKMENPQLDTYSFAAFEDLKSFIGVIDKLYFLKKEDKKIVIEKLPENIKEFLMKNNFEKEFERAKNNSTELKSFRKQFFQWFSAFRIIRFLNISHESYYKKNDIETEAKKLLKMLNINFVNKDLLYIYQKLDRGEYSGQGNFKIN